MRYRIIVCGGRDYADRECVGEIIGRYRAYDPVIVHGAARGADLLADEVAVSMGLEVERHPAMWDLLGSAFPGGRGTANMVKCARENGIPVLLIESVRASDTIPRE